MRTPSGADAESDPVRVLAGELPLLRLRFLLAPEAPFEPPPFPGSMFRGGLGHALLEVACRRDPRRCDGCDLVLRCAYPRVFEPRRSGGEGRGAGPARPPAGFVPEWAPLPDRVSAPYPIDLLLIGSAASLASAVTEAVARMAKTGLGAVRRRHRLLDARSVRSNGDLAPVNGVAEPLAAFLRPLERARRLVIRLRTPLRLKERGSFVRRLTCEHLLRAADRRLRLLHAAARDEPALRSLVRDEGRSAPAVEESRLIWRKVSRRSNRQDTHVPIDGLTGRLVLVSESGEWPTLLAVAEILHAGKGTTNGLGRIGLEAHCP